jgi:hypothetical protein
MSQSDSTVDREVSAFVAEERGCALEEIRPTATLLGDLGLDGDDAEEFITEFSTRFGVDMTGFKFADHFGAEGMFPWQFPRFIWNAMRNMRGEDPHAVAGLRPIRVEDLIQAAKAGRWQSRYSATT